ncbi:hypothetical protein ES703_75758 [subsurface metagenome]
MIIPCLPSNLKVTLALLSSLGSEVTFISSLSSSKRSFKGGIGFTITSAFSKSISLAIGSLWAISIALAFSSSVNGVMGIFFASSLLILIYSTLSGPRLISATAPVKIWSSPLSFVTIPNIPLFLSKSVSSFNAEGNLASGRASRTKALSPFTFTSFITTPFSSINF